MYCGLKYQKQSQTTKQIRLSKAINNATDIVRLVDGQFDQIYDSNINYRATYIAVFDLRKKDEQMDLFGSYEKAEDRSQLDRSISFINKRHGKHALHLASSMQGFSRVYSGGVRGSNPANPLIVDPLSNKALYLPYCGEIS